MDAGLRVGLFAALGTGIGLGIVTTLEGRLGRAVGALNASILEHLLGGGLALALFVILLLSRKLEWGAVKGYIPLAGVLAVLVFVCVAGIAYAIPKTGIAAGTFALVFGQIACAIAIDAMGFAGYERIPISFSRAIGLALMGLGLFFVLPRN
jgi:bacterial/archaeal transporter family-2 protein